MIASMMQAESATQESLTNFIIFPYLTQDSIVPGAIFDLRHNGENIYPETMRILVGELLQSQRHNGGSTVHFTLQIFSVLAFGTVT